MGLKLTYYPPNFPNPQLGLRPQTPKGVAPPDPSCSSISFAPCSLTQKIAQSVASLQIADSQKSWLRLYALIVTVVYKHHNNTIRLTIQHEAALTTCVYR